ncbi:MAG: dUTP diphosphatase [Geodermatophilaceae bacterium]
MPRAVHPLGQVEQPVVDVQILGGSLPSYALPDDAGADLSLTEDVELGPGERVLVGTGIAIALPVGFAGFLHPRSGLAARCGVTLLNAPGTIDAGYRGEIKLNLINLDPRTPVSLRRGDRVAQLIIQPVVTATFRECADLAISERGGGGHGSTGGFAGMVSQAPIGPEDLDAEALGAPKQRS